MTGLGNDRIAEAVARVEAAKHGRLDATLPVLRAPHAWPLTAEIAIVAPDDPSHPLVLLWDPSEGAYRVILLPPGSIWRIRAQQPARSRLVEWLRGLRR